MQLTIKELQDLETEMLVEVDKICRKHNLTYFIAYGTVLGAIRHGGPIPWDADADIIIPYDQLDRFIKIVRNELPDKFFLDYHDINKYFTATFPRIGLKGYSTANLHLDVFMFCGIPSDRNQQYTFQKKVFKLRQIHFYKTNSEIYRGKLSSKYKLRLSFYRLLYSRRSLNLIRDKFDTLSRMYPLKDTEFITNPSGGVYDISFMKKDYFGNGIDINYAGHTVIAPEKTHEYLQHLYDDYMLLPPKSERDKANRTFNLIELKI